MTLAWVVLGVMVLADAVAWGWVVRTVLRRSDRGEEA